MKKILVVEDDLSIQELIYEFLISEKYEVTCAKDGLEGYQMFNDNDFDLIISDVMMKNIDGFKMSEMIRQKDQQVKIILLTALNEEYDELRGFEIGVNDYISKPFSFKVLLKRIENVLRNDSFTQVNIKVDNIFLDDIARIVLVDDKEIILTRKEYEILKLLMQNLDMVISREKLLEDVWGYDYYGDTRVIDTHIKNIRKKTNTKKIKTVSGVGYKMEG